MNLIHSDSLLQLVAGLAVLTAWVGLAGVALHAFLRLARRGRIGARPGRRRVQSGVGREPAGENARCPARRREGQHTLPGPHTLP
ncbi:MAG: hypothetical protein R3B40_13725 [Polyangiales bacterium]|nr:hypothetical protein [Sandaracinaceae bacterium]